MKQIKFILKTRTELSMEYPEDYVKCKDRNTGDKEKDNLRLSLYYVRNNFYTLENTDVTTRIPKIYISKESIPTIIPNAFGARPGLHKGIFNTEEVDIDMTIIKNGLQVIAE